MCIRDRTRLVLLQIDGTDAADSRCVQAIFREHCLHRTHHRFGRDAPPAAYAYVMRSRGVSVSIILQNLAQLKALFEKQWESIVGNCDEFLYLGGNEQSTHK